MDPEVAVRCGIDPDGSQVPEEKSSKHRNSYVNLFPCFDLRNQQRSTVESV